MSKKNQIVSNILVLILVFLLSSLFLTSCVNRKTCVCVAGNFYATNNGVTYYLDIEPITKEEYDLAVGINVIEDKVLEDNKWFSINFYVLDNNVQTNINLKNIVEVCPNTKAIPISYIDVNGIEIQPCYPRKDVSYYYTIKYQSIELNFEGKIAE